MALLLRGVVAPDIAAWPGPGAYSVDCKKTFPSCSLSYSSLLAEQLSVLQRKGNSIETSQEFRLSTPSNTTVTVSSLV